MDTPGPKPLSPSTQTPTQTPTTTYAPPTKPTGTASKVSRQADEKSTTPFERFLGGGIFAVVGALAVVIGLGLLIKAGVDAGWWGNMPDWAKVAGITALGAGLLVTGEAVRRKLPGLAASGISAAGLGGLYAAGLASVSLYEIMGPAAGFACLAAVSALGVAAAVRSGAVSLAVLGLVGAYLTPIVLRPEDPNPAVLPVYLVIVAALGMVLSATKAKFAMVRIVVGIGTVSLGTLWVLVSGDAHWGTALVFVTLLWGMGHADLVYAALKRGLGSPRAVLTSVSITAWSSSMSALVLSSVDGIPAWIAVAGYGGACGLIGLSLSSGLRFMVDGPRTDAERLGIVAWLQCLALAATAVPMAIQGWLAATTWMAFGFAAIVAGRWSRNLALDLYGLAVLLLATGRVLVFDSMTLSTPWLAEPLAGLVFSPWWALMLLLSAAWAGGAVVLIRRSVSRWRWLGDAAACFAVVCLSVAWLHQDAGYVSVGVLVALIGASACVGGVVLWRAINVGAALAVAGAAVLLLATPVGLSGAWTSERDAIMVAGIAVGPWTLACMALGAMWVAVVWVCRTLGSAGVRPLSTIAAGAALLSVLMLFVHTDTSLLMALPIAMALGLIVRLSQGWLPGQRDQIGATGGGTAPSADHGAAGTMLRVEPLRLDLVGIGAVSLIAMVWLVRRFAPVDPGDVTGWPYAAVGLLLTVMILASELCTRRGSIERRFQLSTAAVLGLIASTDAIMRVTTAIGLPEAAANGALSVWWAVLGAGMVALGFRKKLAWLRYVGLGVMLFAALKVVIYDLHPLGTFWRAISLALVGGAMLVVATLYGAVVRATREATEPSQSPSPSTPIPPTSPTPPTPPTDAVVSKHAVTISSIAVPVTPPTAPPTTPQSIPPVAPPTVPDTGHLAGIGRAQLATVPEPARVDWEKTMNETTPANELAGVAAAASAVLDQCACFAESVTPESYTADSEAMSGGTIGKHIRHTLDHFRAAVDGFDAGRPIDYDHRSRGVPVESCVNTAAEEARALGARITSLSTDELRSPVSIRVMLAADGSEAALPSSLARELAFATHHAVHHCAMMKAISNEHGCGCPDDFGMAPSTLNFEQSDQEHPGTN